MTNDELFNEVENVINNDIRGFIEADGGRIKLIEVDGGTVSLKLSGACAHCPGAAMTLRGGVEKILQIRIPEIESVKMVF